MFLLRALSGVGAGSVGDETASALRSGVVGRLHFLGGRSVEVMCCSVSYLVPGIDYLHLGCKARYVATERAANRRRH